MFDFEEAFKLVGRQTVLCVGDLMLDDFVYGEVKRISPEAPTPVLAVRHSEIEIGGAGNVARNVAALGARCIFVALIGNDDAGLALTNALAKLNGGIVPDLVVDRARQTTRKVRFVSEHHSAHLIRADWETADPISAESESALIAYAEGALPQVGAVVLSDYAKGVLTPRVIRSIIDGARRLGKPIVVDPKSHDYSGRTRSGYRLRCGAGYPQRGRHDLAGGRRGAGPCPRLSREGA
jgi:D-beta-D-heptose 7-phosphate kinase / D-beta-D-heptose 1-phosphate adenosyltransferase